MPIDYTRRPKQPAGDPSGEQPGQQPPPATEPPAQPVNQGPSWYRPPTEDDGVSVGAGGRAAAPPPVTPAAPPAQPPTPAAAPPAGSWPPPQTPPVAQQPPAPPAGGWPPPQTPPVAQQPPAPPAPPARGISLSKLTLTKQQPSVNLSKSGGTGGKVRVNLNWTTGAKSTKKGFLANLTGTGGGIDLDLGCLYELSDGSKGVVQALGGTFGSLTGPPYILLDGDDRTGGAVGGENMTIDLTRPGLFRRVLIFAMIYEGIPNWAAANGVVTLTPASGQQFEVQLDASSGRSRICAVALLESQGSELVLKREVNYIDGGQQQLDKAYNWGMNWRAARK